MSATCAKLSSDHPVEGVSMEIGGSHLYLIGDFAQNLLKEFAYPDALTKPIKRALKEFNDA